jgi:hypothetical protein
MKHFAAALSLALLLSATSLADDKMPDLKPLKGTSSLPSAKNPDNFVFILTGDNRPEAASDPPTGIVKVIFKEIKKRAPVFVLWTGDIVYGKDSKDPDKVAQEYKDFLKLAAGANAPIFNAPGNHEMNDKNNCPSAKLLSLYLDDALPDKPDKPYGSFDYGDSHFIALNSDEDAPSGDSCNCASQPKDSKPPGYISQSQMDLLASDLEANKKKAHIFIFLHRPLEGYKGEDQLCPKNVSDMQDLFKKYPNVSYVVAGHQHMYYNPQDPEFGAPPARTDPSQPPYYLVSGGAGAPLKKKGFYHYLIFTVDGSKVSVEVVPVEEKDAD